MNTLKAKLVRYVPDWSKPVLRRMLAVYRKANFAFKKTERRLHPPALPENRNGKVYIHLGCGEINAPGFINVDAIPFPHVHYVQEVNDLSIFPNEYADLIYASHVLEHISHREVTKVLKEWNRVLKIEGTLRIAVPDFDKIIDIYSSEGYDISAIMRSLMGGQNYAHNFHKTVFNKKYLTELLLSVGFREVKEWNPEEVEMHSFDDWASKPVGKRYWASLNLEAVK